MKKQNMKTIVRNAMINSFGGGVSLVSIMNCVATRQYTLSLTAMILLILHAIFASVNYKLAVNRIDNAGESK